MIIDKSIYDKVSKITMTDYEPIYESDKYIILTSDCFTSMLENLLSEIDNIQEKIEDLEQDIQDNYKPIRKAEQYDCEMI